jgi:hypothetical protein
VTFLLLMRAWRNLGHYNGLGGVLPVGAVVV